MKLIINIILSLFFSSTLLSKNFPINGIEGMWTKLGGTQYFFKLDEYSGIFQADYMANDGLLYTMVDYGTADWMCSLKDNGYLPINFYEEYTNFPIYSSWKKEEKRKRDAHYDRIKTEVKNYWIIYGYIKNGQNKYDLIIPYNQTGWVNWYFEGLLFFQDVSIEKIIKLISMDFSKVKNETFKKFMMIRVEFP